VTPSGSESTPATHKTALVVDSGTEINQLLKEVFSSEGWDMELVPDNQAVLSLAPGCPCDLIITGAKTRGPVDIELLHKIRGIRPHMRIIILTDEWTPGDVIAAMREGAFSYFSGPLEHTALVDMVRAAMEAPCWDDGIEILSATPEWVRLTARCDIDTANRLTQFLRGVKDPNVPEEDWEEVITAFREILMNAIEHGGHLDPSQYVEISFVHARRALMCRVKDPGEGFSMEELKHAAINSSPGDVISHVAVRDAQGLRPGGFGLLMAKKLVDELIYNEKGNDVLLIKYLPPAGARAAEAAGKSG
jgi:anti-sigma regulatory factor (Ser/Thr protein kinase)/DNA-binding NarL/FixJ family response regulator